MDRNKFPYQKGTKNSLHVLKYSSIGIVPTLLNRALWNLKIKKNDMLSFPRLE